MNAISNSVHYVTGLSGDYAVGIDGMEVVLWSSDNGTYDVECLMLNNGATVWKDVWTTHTAMRYVAQAAFMAVNAHIVAQYHLLTTGV